MAENYTLYGAEVSYYTGKARAYMDWAGVPYDEQIADEQVYRKVIMPRVGWPVIPVVAGPDDEVLQDTSDIIDTLDGRYGPPSVYPDDPVQLLVALLFEVLGDEWLTLPAMLYRWKYNRDFAYAEFGRLSAPDKSPEEQFEIGRKRATNFEGALPILGIDERTQPAIEARYLELLGHLDAHFAAHEMLLGDRPSIGDFGLYGPLYAHQYRDPASGEIMKREAPRVAGWVERLRDDKAAKPGAFLADGAVPETLLPILARQFEEQFPVLQSTAAALTNWAADKESGEAVPRALGTHEFTVGGATGSRLIFPFNLWMLQRPLAVYAAMSDEDKARADMVLLPLGGAAFTAFPAFPELARVNYKLALA